MADRDGSTFVAMPHIVLQSPGWRRASSDAKALLLDLAAPLYRSGKDGPPGLPNGGLMADRRRLFELGWRSVSTLSRALRDLMACGLLVETRKGGKHRPSLYAVTWHGLTAQPPKYQLDIDTDPLLWKAAYRGLYLTPEKPEPASQAARTRAATNARRAVAAVVVRGDVAGPSDGRKNAPIGPSDGQSRQAIGPWDGLVAGVAPLVIGPSDGLSLEHCHLPAGRQAVRRLVDRAESQARAHAKSQPAVEQQR